MPRLTLVFYLLIALFNMITSDYTHGDREPSFLSLKELGDKCDDNNDCGQYLFCDPFKKMCLPL